MAEHGSIFRKQRLTPGQLRAVAERRYNDAVCLLRSGENERANGAIYMGGFVLECLLKAILLERHRNLGQRVDPAKLSSPDREAYLLLYSHSLVEILEFLPEVQTKFRLRSTAKGTADWRRFKTVCEQWTVYARYSSRSASIGEARQFLATINEVKEWLKQL